MEKTFSIRAWSKAELALFYHPHLDTRRALRILNRWIRHNPLLLEALRREGAGITTRVYSPRQMEVIVRFLGEP
ncbi:MAG: DUF4248 domain-containing protein [Bacteroides sp.]|nr:DUF4248 domain-containing protein [Bacteroides sp.]